MNKYSKGIIILFIINILFLFFALSLMLYAASEPVNAKGKEKIITTEINKGDGYLDYTINDRTGDWQSKLEFPLDYTSIQINFKNKFNDYFLKESNFYISKNLNDSSDPFKDSDWININFNEKPNIYAETDTKIDYIEYEGNLLFDDNLILENLYWGLGYNYSKRNYDMIGGYQNDYINMYHYKFDNDLKVMEYEVEINRPFLSLNYIFDNNKSSYINFDIEFSPYVKIQDYDNHILRNKTAVSDTQGLGIEIELKNNIHLNKNFVFTLGYSYEKIKTTGTQTQNFSDGSKIKVDQEINLENNIYQIALNYSF